MMQAFCAPPADGRFASRLLADTDCQAYGLIERGYAALAQPGGSVSAALTGLMVIAVAFFGYRLLLGRGLALREAMDLIVKIGVVLLIATSWEAWSALAYQGIAQAPAQIAADMLVGIGSPPPLESLQKTLDSLANAAVGYRMRAGIASPLVGGPAAAAAVLNVTAIVLTLGTVGMLVAAKVVQAIMLAIAPAMAGFLLFDGTRGLVAGWLGAIVAAALAPLFVLLVASIEFAILMPMVERLLAEQSAGTFENSSVMPIGLVAVVFAIATAFALRAASRIGYGVRLAARRRPERAESERSTERTVRERTGDRVAEPASRVVQALEQIARRDPAVGPPRLSVIAGGRASEVRRDSDRVSPAAVNEPSLPTLSRTTRMRSAARQSRAAARRDQ
jgi:type IV secretion system protein VirB6